MAIWMLYLVFGLAIGGIEQIFAVNLETAKKIGKVLHRDCVKKTGVDEKLIAECAKGYIPDDEVLKCYIKCLMTTVPVLKKGKVDEEYAISVSPDEYKDHMAAIIRACGTVQGVDDCDTAYRTNLCWQSKDPENYYLI